MIYAQREISVDKVERPQITFTSRNVWLCLIPVIGGVCLASLKELDFAVSALVAASIANIFAAFKANENAEVMSTPGLKDRLGSVGNQFAIRQSSRFLSLFRSSSLKVSHSR